MGRLGLQLLSQSKEIDGGIEIKYIDQKYVAGGSRQRRLQGKNKKVQGWTNWENSTETYTLPYVKWIASGTLLFDTGSSTQCSVTTQKGGEGQDLGERFKKEETYVYLWLIHIVWQKPTQHYKAISL